uniref:Uncharacterized protein n=1 Tax=Arundo donax TaxID=35708 RepID=A0A0A9FC40_ARUDO
MVNNKQLSSMGRTTISIQTKNKINC